MSNYKFLNPIANEIYYVNQSNSTINIVWSESTNPSSPNVTLSLVDLGPIKNPNPYGQVVSAITGNITQLSPGVRQCAWAVPLNFAFNPNHFYVIYIENAPGPATTWAYSQPFNILLGATVPAPVSGLGSNSNYFIYSGCGPLIDLSITIDVAEDIVFQSTTGPTKGFGFQLNAYSPPNMTCAYQQYVFAVINDQIQGSVENWPVSGNNLFNAVYTNLAPAINNTIPAGHKLKIILQNDINGNVTGIIWVVVDSKGNTVANLAKTLTSISGVTSADLAPIVAFELNLVGANSSENVVLASGGGTILYAASTPLMALNQEPSCTETGSVTAETANSFYGVLPALSSNGLIQSFTVKTTERTIHKDGPIRPSITALLEKTNA